MPLHAHTSSTSGSVASPTDSERWKSCSVPFSTPWSAPVKTTSTAPSSTPASASTPASDVPVQVIVPTASCSHGWLTGRGDRRARPLPAHSRVTVRVTSVRGRDVVVGEQVVRTDRRDVVAQQLERHPVVAGGEADLVEADAFTLVGEP